MNSGLQLGNSPSRYGLVPQALHWLTVLLVVAGWLLGNFGDEFPRGSARAAALFVHVSAGLAILALLVARVAWRTVDQPPPPEPQPFGVWGERVAAMAHYALYALLVVAPLSGVVTQFARGDALPVFGLFEVASPWVRDRAFSRSVKEVHETLSNLLMILAVLHAAAALFHHWILRDRTLRRMLPGDR